MSDRSEMIIALLEAHGPEWGEGFNAGLKVREDDLRRMDAAYLKMREALMLLADDSDSYPMGLVNKIAQEALEP